MEKREPQKVYYYTVGELVYVSKQPPDSSKSKWLKSAVCLKTLFHTQAHENIDVSELRPEWVGDN